MYIEIGNIDDDDISEIFNHHPSRENATVTIPQMKYILYPMN